MKLALVNYRRGFEEAAALLAEEEDVEKRHQVPG
jgi:hypothetical protein